MLVNEQALCGVLGRLHDEIDLSVAEAYGWPASLSDAQMISLLVDLNAERAAEERAGTVRWLRPEIQRKAATGKNLDLPGTMSAPTKPLRAPHKRKTKAPWPKSLPEQANSVRRALAANAQAVAANELAAHWKGARPEAVAELLETLVALGQARRVGDKFTA